MLIFAEWTREGGMKRLRGVVPDGIFARYQGSVYIRTRNKVGAFAPNRVVPQE